MNHESEQLFHLLHNVDVSYDAQYDATGKSYTQATLIVPATFAVTWPDKTPCSLVEIFLISRFRDGATVQEDGGSLRAIVSKLSHLIRHCWQIQRDFWELCSDDFDSLIVKLTTEMKSNAPFARKRNNNTVRAIIASGVEFLLWLQSEILVGHKLIGNGRQFNIRLNEKKVYDNQGRRQGTHMVYCRLPPPETKEPKRPMSREKRNQLWQGVTDMSMRESRIPACRHKNNDQTELKLYLKARRELLLELLEATGARPGELARLSVLANADCCTSGELILVTLKRRRAISRKIKLQPSVAVTLTVFIRKHRRNLVNSLQASGVKFDPLDHLFLGVEGDFMTARTLTSEFSRISKASGLGEYQSCMSMFRHRFITKQVALHLGAYLSDNNKTKEMMTDGDYRTILKKVATVTGHGSEQSLLHYLHLAWEELGVFDRVEAAILIDASIEGAITKVISLAGTLRRSKFGSPEQMLNSAVEILKNLQLDIKSSVQK